ncbi:hypothetical protein BVRB_5g122390 [Beta vulgaris subsp. vulgaris]|nr:hypothetical protein BVRB_5g122390 [Beta vulgaris subsp. vulgaris]
MLDLWELFSQLCHLTIVDMKETMVMEALIGRAEITIGSDIMRMNVILLTCRRETNRNHVETLIMNLDRRKIRVSMKVGTLMMIRSVVLRLTRFEDLKHLFMQQLMSVKRWPVFQKSKDIIVTNRKPQTVDSGDKLQ